MPRTDLQPLVLGDLDKIDWKQDGSKAVITLRDSVRSKASAVISWYVDAKNAKRMGATTTRVGTIVATTAATLCTAVAATGQDGNWLMWAAVAAAITAVMQGFDRFFGFSRAWMRYITTELKVRTALNAFNMTWPSRMSVWVDGKPNPDEIQKAIAACASFVTEIDTIVQQETDQWIADFQASLKNLQEATTAAAAATKAASDAEAERHRQQEADRKSKEAAARPGSVNITVTNGPQFPAGWTITCNGEVEGRGRSGKTAAVTGVGPGNVSIAVEGEAGGTKKRAEKVVPIAAGGVTDCELTLE